MNIRKILLLVAILLLIGQVYAWWNESWRYRQNISISNTAGDLTNYQVKIILNSSNVGSDFDWSTGGSDIRFTYYNISSELENEIPFWIATWDSSSQTATIWVNVTYLQNNTNTTIYMYYGNPSASSKSNATTTFYGVLDNVVGIWHFDEGSGSILHDESSNGHDGTISGAIWESGKFGYALHFDGSNDYVNVSQLGDFWSNGFSIVSWINTDTDHNGLIVSGDDVVNSISIFQYKKKLNGSLEGILYDDSGGANFLDSPAMGNGIWHLFSLVYNGSVGKLYVNTTLYEELTVTLNQGNPEIWFGLRNDKTTNPYDGLIDEIYIFSDALTEDEISLLYNYYPYANSTNAYLRKYASPEPSYNIGEEEINPEILVLTVTSPKNTTYTTQTINITGSTNKNANITYEFDSNGTVYIACINCTSFNNQTVLQDGVHNVTITAVQYNDSSKTDTKVIAFTIDTTPPGTITNLRVINISTSSITWKWDNPTDADFDHVELWLNGEFKVNTSANNYTFTGLTPGNTYTLQTRTVDTVGNINTTWVNDTTQTLRVLAFLVTTDSHYGDPEHSGPVRTKDVIYDMQETSILNFSRFILHLGDFVHSGTDSNWDEAMEVLNQSYVPMWFILGNHDNHDYVSSESIPTLAMERFMNETSMPYKTTYAFMYYNVLFIFLGDYDEVVTLSPELKDWLLFITSLYPNTTTIIVNHQEICDTNYPDADLGEYRCSADSDWWDSFLNNNSQIKLYIHGHNHVYGDSADNVKLVGNCIHVLAPTMRYGIWSYNYAPYITINETHIRVQFWDPVNNKFVTGQDALYNIPTTVNSSKGMEWFAIPEFNIQDGQSFVIYNHIVARNVTLKLIGQSRQNLHENPNFFYKIIHPAIHNAVLYWQNTSAAQNVSEGLYIPSTSIPITIYTMNSWIDAGRDVEIYGHMEGKIPFTTGLAIPGKTYYVELVVNASTNVDNAVDIEINITNKSNQYDIIQHIPVVTNASVTTEPTKISGTFTVVDNQDAWYIMVIFRFKNSSASYTLRNMTLKRVNESGTTDNFAVVLNGKLYNSSTSLADKEYVEFYVGETYDDIFNFSSVTIDGNHIGWIILTYNKPEFFVRGADVKVISRTDDDYKIEVTTIRSRQGKYVIFPIDADLDMYLQNETENITVNTTANSFKFYISDSPAIYTISTTPITELSDTTPPTIAFVPPTFQNNTKYEKNYIEVNVTATDNVAIDTIKICLYDDSGLITCQTSTTSPFFYNFTGLEIGKTYYINATVNDTSGNINFTETRKIILTDETPPSIVINTPEPKAYSTTLFVLSTTITDALAGVDSCWYSIDDAPPTTFDCSSATFTVEEGNHTIKVWANDTLGNTNIEITTFTVDLTPPTIIILNPEPKEYSTNEIVLRTQVTDALAGVRSCWYSIDNWRTNITYDCISKIITLPEGKITLRVGAKDFAGNINTMSIIFRVMSRARHLSPIYICADHICTPEELEALKVTPVFPVNQTTTGWFGLPSLSFINLPKLSIPETEQKTKSEKFREKKSEETPKTEVIYICGDKPCQVQVMKICGNETCEIPPLQVTESKGIEILNIIPLLLFIVILLYIVVFKKRLQS